MKHALVYAASLPVPRASRWTVTPVLVCVARTLARAAKGVCWTMTPAAVSVQL